MAHQLVLLPVAVKMSKHGCLCLAKHIRSNIFVEYGISHVLWYVNVKFRRDRRVEIAFLHGFQLV